MSDGMSDAYRMEDEARIKKQKHLELLAKSSTYATLNDSLKSQYALLKTTQSAISIMEGQQDKLLEDYITKTKT